jgi:hypothetical protein
LLELLHPREYTGGVLVALAIGLVASWLTIRFWNWPLWAATALVLVALLPVGILKWRQDRRRYGPTVMLLGIILVSQGAHTIEHVVQWMQYHVLFWTMRQSSGLLSPANAEWVHFVWNWGVFIIVILLMRGGMRNGWMYLLLGVSLLHSLEHTYMLVRHLLVLNELHHLGVHNVGAQGLPGILGRDGWLARSASTQGTFVRGLQGLTTAIRLDVHFWWNFIEMVLLSAAGHRFLSRQWVQDHNYEAR